MQCHSTTKWSFHAKSPKIPFPILLKLGVLLESHPTTPNFKFQVNRVRGSGDTVHIISRFSAKRGVVAYLLTPISREPLGHSSQNGYFWKGDSSTISNLPSFCPFIWDYHVPVFLRDILLQYLVPAMHCVWGCMHEVQCMF